jgi:hypothetical protein
VKKLRVGSLSGKEACAGAPAPPGGTRAPRAFSAAIQNRDSSGSSRLNFFQPAHEREMKGGLGLDSLL